MSQAQATLVAAVAQYLVQAMQQQNPQDAAFKAVSGTPNTNYAHGVGGLFSDPALERDIYSAIIAAPFSGLQHALPVRGTTVENPLDGIITGVTDTTGSEPNGVCDDPPTAGLVKLCEHAFVLGRFSRQTPVYDISRGTRFANRGEHRDFQIFGGPASASGNMGGFAPQSLPLELRNAANTEVGKIMLAYVVAWARDFARKIYTGNPATGNTAGGGHKEFYGLNILINTGYRDAVTGTACPAADSIVRNYNAQVRANPSGIVEAVTSTYFELMTKAAMANLAPVEWVLTMPLSLFYELTRIWPCSYLTDGCTLTTNQTAFVDTGDQVRMRDEMRGDLNKREGQFLWILGRKVPVVLDDAIPLAGGANGIYTASMYFVPLTVLGGQPVTYLEYMDYNAIGVEDGIRAMAPTGFFRITDNGRFLMVVKAPNNLCVQIYGLTEPRLKLLTPYLAARIDNIGFAVLPNMASGFPDQPSFFRDGGRTNYIGFGPSYFSPTA